MKDTVRRVNNDMIALARESRGLTQTALAIAVGMTQATLSKYENGTLRVAEDHLSELAKVLDYPEEFFYQPGPVRWTGSGCMYHRKRQSVGVNEYRQLLARVNILRMSVWRLLQGVEIQAENKFFRLDVAENGSPTKIAALVRNTWNLPPGPIGNLTTAIEAAGGIVLKCDFGRTKLDAFSQWPPEMPPIFFVNRATPPDRYRFTLAHEIGHIILHVVPTANLEAEADEFAAEFMMPKRDILAHFGRPFSLQKAAELKAYWGMSMAALIRRGRDLGRISNSYYRTLMTRLSAAGYRKLEPVSIPDEEPSVVHSIIDVHLSQHGYSTKDLSQVALINEDEFIEGFVVPTTSPPEKPHLRSIK